jgi:glycosyltransferase involved in cell wall biosynthesis
MTDLDLKIFTSHPVHYHVPFFKAIAAHGVNLEVGYYHQGTAAKTALDAEFGIHIQWDVDLLSGYQHRTFLPCEANYSFKEQISIMRQVLHWGQQTPKVPLLLVGWGMHLFWLVWFLRQLRGLPTMVLAETNLQSYALSTRPKWLETVLKRLLRGSKTCFYIGSQSKAFYQAMGVTEAQLRPALYSVDNAFFAQQKAELMPQRAALCAQYGLDPNLPTFVFSGKLIEKKRPLELLRGYLEAGLADKAQLIFVGEGALRPQLEAAIAEAGAKHVHLLGFLNTTQMPLAYVLGQCLCLLSEPSETWGLVVNEAMASGCPVLVSQTVGSAIDLVGNAGENGWVVPLDDHATLVSALRLAYGNAPRWLQMGEISKQKVADHTFEAMAQSVARTLPLNTRTQAQTGPELGKTHDRLSARSL